MRAFAFASLLPFALTLGAFASAPHAFDLAAPGHHHARMVKKSTSSGNNMLQKRFDNARFTFYETGLGACGKTNTDSDFIVALNSAQYNGGQFCFQEITITVNGKSTSAQITDECPGCPYGGLDMSPGLFQFFADESAGVLTGSWDFGSGGSSAPTTTAAPPPPPPTTSSTPPPPPPTTSSTFVAPTPTPTPTTSSTPPPPSTTSSSSSLAPISSVSSILANLASSSTAQPSSSAVPSETSEAAPSATATGAMEQIFMAVLGMDALVAAGAAPQS